MCSPTSGSFEQLGAFSTFCKYARRPWSEASSFGAPPERLVGGPLARRKRSKHPTSSRSCLRSCGTPSARRRPVELYSTFQPGLLVIPRAFEAGVSVRTRTEGFGLSCGAHQSVVDRFIFFLFFELTFVRKLSRHELSGRPFERGSLVQPVALGLGRAPRLPVF